METHCKNSAAVNEYVRAAGVTVQFGNRWVGRKKGGEEKGGEGKGERERGEMTGSSEVNTGAVSEG